MNYLQQYEELSLEQVYVKKYLINLNIDKPNEEKDAKEKIAACEAIIQAYNGHIDHLSLPADAIISKKYIAKAINSRSRGIDFDLSWIDFKRMMLRKKCFYTGRKMVDFYSGVNSDARTIDRIDSSKGYTKENTVACTSYANSLKNQLFEMDGRKLSNKEIKQFFNKTFEVLK